MPAEAKCIAQCSANGAVLGLVKSKIEARVEVRVIGKVVDGGRLYIVINRQHTGAGLYGTRRTE